MTTAEIVLSNITDFHPAKAFRTSAAFILTSLMLVVAAATPVLTAQTYTDLYNFDGTHGANPWDPGILAQGRDGNLYGTVPEGGSTQCYLGCGVVFQIMPSGTLTVLHYFDGADGLEPRGGLTLGTDGNFYGTAFEGGTYLYGTIFKITPSGSLTTLYSLNGSPAGYPFAPPIQGSDGNFYGTTESSSSYKITSSGSFTLLGPTPDTPRAPLLEGTDGNFYGTTFFGGNYTSYCSYAGGAVGCGTVFKMTPQGIVTPIYSFDGTHGANPSAPLIQGSDGNLYGTTSGFIGASVVFALTPQGAITVLHYFGDVANDGCCSEAGLVQASDGNFYGATAGGGTMGYGVIFQITPAGAYSILYNFDGTDGATPWSTPMQHTNGKIYGLTNTGGALNDGVAYSFDVGLPPFVSMVESSGQVGETVELLGQGFSEATEVSFNGTAATFAVVSDTCLTAVVPDGAATGPVTVTMPGGPLSTNRNFVVTPNTTKTVLSPLSPVFYGAPVTFAATVTSGSTGTPFGDVTFTDGTTLLGTQTLNSSGVATLSIATLAVGSHSITAAYAGNNDFVPSTSPALVQVVNPSGFSVSESGLAPTALNPGQSATSTLTIASDGKLNNSVSLTCSVAPTPSFAPTCALNPASVTPTVDGSAKSTLTIRTTGATAALTHPVLRHNRRPFYAWWMPISGLALAGVGFASDRSRRKKTVAFLLTCLLVTGLVFLAACGGASGGSSLGTPAGSYTVTVIATSGSIEHIVTMTLTVVQ